MSDRDGLQFDDAEVSLLSRLLPRAQRCSAEAVPLNTDWLWDALLDNQSQISSREIERVVGQQVQHVRSQQAIVSLLRLLEIAWAREDGRTWRGQALGLKLAIRAIDMAKQWAVSRESIDQASSLVHATTNLLQRLTWRRRWRHEVVRVAELLRGLETDEISDKEIAILFEDLREFEIP